jgi:crotonobetainyl-CoA:carnitine CoA-transferase CaiB-like acyl-CoA transferase
MSITGDSDSAPLRVGYPMADSIGGITAAFAIAASLVGRSRSGKGAYIDVSMLDSTIATMGWVVSNYLIAGQEPAPIGNDNFTAAPSGAFKASDGLLNIAANKQEQFESLARVIGREDLIADERFAAREARKRNRAVLTSEIEAALASRTAAEWEQTFNAAGVPAGRILSVPEALALDQVRERGLVQRFENVEALERPLSLTLAGYVTSEDGPTLRSPPPRLGEHVDEILAELGCSEAEIESLRAEDVI